MIGVLFRLSSAADAGAARMFPQLVRLVKFLFVGSMAVFAAVFLLIGGLFLFQLWTAYGPKVALDAPGGGWTVTLQEVSFADSHTKTATVSVHEGPMRGHELFCRFDEPTSDRRVFGAIASTVWRDGGLKLDWTTASDPPQRGTLDIAAQCSDTAVFSDRPSNTTLRFHETCLVSGCARRVEWIEQKTETVSTPCRTDATGDAPVFTVPGDALGQIDVDFDHQARIARWTSRGTGQSGAVDFVADCDPSRERRSPVPP